VHHIPESHAQRVHTCQTPMQVWVWQQQGAMMTSDKQCLPEMSWIPWADQMWVPVGLVPVRLINILEGGTQKLP